MHKSHHPRSLSNFSENYSEHCHFHYMLKLQTKSIQFLQVNQEDLYYKRNTIIIRENQVTKSGYPFPNINFFNEKIIKVRNKIKPCRVTKFAGEFFIWIRMIFTRNKDVDASIDEMITPVNINLYFISLPHFILHS